MATIHPTAVVADGATIAPTATIGPYCVIGARVTLAADVWLHSHVVVDGLTSIGEGTKVYPFASLGTPPQDLKFKGEASRLIIGAHNTIREHVTMNPGTEGGGLITRVGDHCLFMVGVHIAHDCQVGNHVIMANNATLAGHVVIEDHAVIGGLAALHQFVRVGKHSMIGGLSGVENDVIPYATVMGERARLAGLNFVGLKRRGFDRDTISALRDAYQRLFTAVDTNATFADRLNDVSTHYADHSVVMEIINFIQADASRALCQPRNAA